VAKYLTGQVRMTREIGILAQQQSSSLSAIQRLRGQRPFDGKNVKGRIAYSGDGNHNDEDDWAASPVALAIFAEFGVKDKLVHFDYNSILPETNPEWEKQHETSVLGAAERYGYRKSTFQTAGRMWMQFSPDGSKIGIAISGPAEASRRSGSQRFFVFLRVLASWRYCGRRLHQRSSECGRTGLISMMGVPSIASMGATLSLCAATSRTETR
jgi:hypothetical protein